MFGNACGALSVGAYGGSTGTPSREGLDAFIQSRENHTENQEEVLP